MCAPQAAGAAWADDDPEFTHVVARQGALADDLTRAVAYGESHPEVFGGVWWDGPRLQVGFTSPQAHQADVRALLEHPADVDVLQVRWTLRPLTQVRAAVERRIEQAPGMWQSISGGAQRVTLNLRADGTALAAELLETHGEMLELTVGGRPYPSDPAAPVEAPPGPVATAVRPDLELRAICHQSEVVSGRGHTGELHIRNTGGQTVQVVSEQPLVATLLSTDGRVAGSSIGFVAGTGLVLDLPPGDTASIRFLGGTAGGPEYATRPGRTTWSSSCPCTSRRRWACSAASWSATRSR